MGRQRFLHHYLPSHVASCLVTGALVEFMFNIEPVESESESRGRTGPAPHRRLRGVRRQLGRQSLLAVWAASSVILAVSIWSFVFYAPLTYGTPGLDVDAVNGRKWLSYDLHFAK
jgi:dolichyl-phosphate-mannose-protein mannosyltransferase